MKVDYLRCTAYDSVFSAATIDDLANGVNIGYGGRIGEDSEWLVYAVDEECKQVAYRHLVHRGGGEFMGGAERISLETFLNPELIQIEDLLIPLNNLFYKAPFADAEVPEPEPEPESIPDWEQDLLDGCCAYDEEYDLDPEELAIEAVDRIDPDVNLISLEVIRTAFERSGSTPDEVDGLVAQLRGFELARRRD